jgi:hypothetical protein
MSLRAKTGFPGALIMLVLFAACGQQEAPIQPQELDSQARVESPVSGQGSGTCQ